LRDFESGDVHIVESMLPGVQQHPYLLALLASDDAHECCSASHTGVALFRLSILYRACASQA
jgi:hypothetical protein